MVNLGDISTPPNKTETLTHKASSICSLFSFISKKSSVYHLASIVSFIYSLLSLKKSSV